LTKGLTTSIITIVALGVMENEMVINRIAKISQ